MGVFESDLEEYEGDIEELFTFNVYITPESEVEIGISIKEIEIEAYPEFGREYSECANLYADLIVEHIGMRTEILLSDIADLPELAVELTEEEESVLNEKVQNENGSVLLYSFPVLLMADVSYEACEDEDCSRALSKDGESCECDTSDESSNIQYYGQRHLVTKFGRSQMAELMHKVYGEEFTEAEAIYEDLISRAILDHGILFYKAVDAIRIHE